MSVISHVCEPEHHSDCLCVPVPGLRQAAWGMLTAPLLTAIPNADTRSGGKRVTIH